MIFIKKILSLSIALVFLVSATGVYFVKHTCLHSGETTILLGEKHSCCEQHNDNYTCCDHSAGDGICPVHGDHKDCCKNHIVYLKGESEYQKSEITASFKLKDCQPIEIAAMHLVTSSSHKKANSAQNTLYKPPRDILIRNSILIL